MPINWKETVHGSAREAAVNAYPYGVRVEARYEAACGPGTSSAGPTTAKCRVGPFETQAEAEKTAAGWA